jgi:ribose 5-phosphate isomerase RpiB
VLADLSVHGDARVAPPVKTLPQTQVQTSPQEKASALRLPDSPVTLALLEGRLDGVREVVISPKAIVTPSVRDLLYKKEIKLALAQSESRSAASPSQVPSAIARNSNTATGTTTVWLALHQLKREPETLIQFLQGNTGPDKEALVKESFDCIVATTQAAAKRLAESESLRAIIVTNHSAAAMVLANRHTAIRAIIGSNPEQTAQDAAMVGANLLVLHPDRLGAYRMKEMARVFLMQNAECRMQNEFRV